MALTNKTGRKHEHLFAWSSNRKEWFCEKCNEVLACDHNFVKHIEKIVWFTCTNCPGEYHESQAL
jgi:RNase P subunit RPR2